MDGLNLSDSDPDALFDSPNTKSRKHKAKLSQSDQDAPARQTPKGELRYNNEEDEETREAALRAELDAVRNINTTIENLTSSLEAARANMSTVNNTVAQSSTLLHTWTRILSTTEHNTRLILNPNWHGASADLADMENEERQRQVMAERREREEQERREQAQRRAEEEERRRVAAAAAPGRTRGARGRVGASGKTPTSGGRGSGYVGVGGQGGRGVGRGSTTGRASSSGIGRGARGRARGA